MYKLNKLVEYINEAYSTYEYHLVYSEIHRFCTTELSSKYLDVIKIDYTHLELIMKREEAHNLQCMISCIHLHV